jgi:hypothetical protein
MKCQRHGHFTLYPMGHLPYSRTSVAPVNVAGDALRSTHADGLATWRGTIFEAPLRACHGSSWYRDLGSDALSHRHTLRAGAILGLSPDIGALQVEQIRAELRLPGLDHVQARRAYAASEDHAGRARAIVPLLGFLASEPSLCERILRAGALAGTWGQPQVLSPPRTRSLPTPPAALPAPVSASGAPHETVAAARGDPPTLPLLARTSRQEVLSCPDMPSD